MGDRSRAAANGPWSLIRRLWSGPGREGKAAPTAGYFGAFVALGLAAAALGPTLPGLADHTGSALSQVSILFTARSLGYLLGALQGGHLLDRLPGHGVLGVALLAMAGILALVPFVPILWLLAVAMIVLGLAEGAVEVCSNAMLLWLHREGAGPYINGLHFFFGVGAFLAPVVVAQAVLRTGDSVWAYCFLGALLLPVAAWVLRLPSPAAKGAASDRPATPEAGGWLVLLVALFFLLYVGMEGSYGGWIATYAQRLGLASAATSAYMTSAFWGALTVGRLVATLVSIRVPSLGLVTAGLAGTALSLALLLLWPRSPAVAWVGTVTLGLSLAPIVPMTLALLQRRVHITGRATGWFFFGLGSGNMTVPWLIGQFFESTGPLVMLWIISGCLVLALSLFGLLVGRIAVRPLPLPSER